MKGHVMAEKDLGELFLHTLKDVYFAEHEILKTLPKMTQGANNSRLKQAFDQHCVQTEGQIQRLQQVFSLLPARPSRASSLKAQKWWRSSLTGRRSTLV
jgi:ferritin-like metal-binding protein YciE